MGPSEIDQSPEGRARGRWAVEVSELRDLIEVESRVLWRMRRLELPAGVLAVVFFLTMLATRHGTTWPLVILAVWFSVLLARSTLRYRRRADHVSELEEQLAELEAARSERRR